MYVEQLEPRRLLSVMFDGRVWRIDGTERADDIRLYVFRTPADETIDLFINGEEVDIVTVLPRDGLFLTLPRRVVIRGQRGGDSIDVDLSGYVPLITISGGPGPDRITLDRTQARAFGNGGNDVIRVPFGGRGDTLLGGSGDDVLNVGRAAVPGGLGRGGRGNDIVTGGEWADTLHGGPGDDLLLGRRGDDHLAGGAGRDTLRGDFGEDLLRGGVQRDRLAGRAGDDSLFGGAGRDTLLQDVAKG